MNTLILGVDVLPHKFSAPKFIDYSWLFATSCLHLGIVMTNYRTSYATKIFYLENKLRLKLLDGLYWNNEKKVSIFDIEYSISKLLKNCNSYTKIMVVKNNIYISYKNKHDEKIILKILKSPSAIVISDKPEYFSAGPYKFKAVKKAYDKSIEEYLYEAVDYHYFICKKSPSNIILKLIKNDELNNFLLSDKIHISPAMGTDLRSVNTKLLQKSSLELKYFFSLEIDKYSMPYKDSDFHNIDIDDDELFNFTGGSYKKISKKLTIPKFVKNIFWVNFYPNKEILNLILIFYKKNGIKINSTEISYDKYVQFKCKKGEALLSVLLVENEYNIDGRIVFHLFKAKSTAISKVMNKNLLYFFNEFGLFDWSLNKKNHFFIGNL